MITDKIIVIDKDGSEISLEQWQKQYGLEIGSNNIGNYFSLSEKRFANDITAFGKLIVNSLLMRVVDAYRSEVNRPVTFNSFNRSEEYQENLKARGFKTAKYSPHVPAMAGDIDTTSEEETREGVRILLKISARLKIKIRIGSEQYLKEGSTFIHLDVCPEYYAPGKPFHHKPHPVQWEREARW